MLALKKQDEMDAGCCIAVNLGTGKPYSVFDMLDGMSKAIKRTIPYEICGRYDWHF